MRLINTHTRDFEEFLGRNIPKYAILSHTWEGEEVSYADYVQGRRRLISRMNGYAKIDMTCKIAAEQGIPYAWIDTCCIDKRSSAELTEAINSMFRWYERAEVCYAFLSDLWPRASQGDTVQAMRDCRWFTRGWTLQELLAPGTVQFFNSEWDCIGSKDSMSVTLIEITGIPGGILSKHDSLQSIPVATRMSWAATRVTTRIEDIAYCLLGLFDVNMPLLYGEEEKAFQRLQEEIIKHIPDSTILAWKSPVSDRRHEPDSRIYCGVLAEAPSHFAWCKGTQLIIRSHTKGFSISNNRITIVATIFSASLSKGRYMLPIQYQKATGGQLLPESGVCLRKIGDGQFLRSDPHTIVHNIFCHDRDILVGTHQLLLKPPSAQTSSSFSFTSSNRITEEYLSRLRPRSTRITSDPYIYPQAVSPMSRFDMEDNIFFVSDEADNQNDWGIFHFSVKLDHSKWNLDSPPIECVLYTTSWGPPSAPQCSVIPTLPYADQVDDLQSRLSRWDHSTYHVLSSLVGFNIPCARSAVVDLPGTGCTAAVLLTVRAREDVPPWMPRDHAWDVHISCSVYESDRVPSTQNESQWKIDYQ